MDNKFFTFIKPYLSYIDNGYLYRKPFSWLYGILAIANLLFPVLILYKAGDNHIFDNQNIPTKFIIVFILIWLIIAFASWVSFQLWWDRKSKVIATSFKKDEFVATPVFSHFIQTLGEWIGTWIGIVGFSVALLTTIFFGDEGYYLSYQLGLGFLKTGFLYILLMPVYGFLIIVLSRFVAEQLRALSSIANNTRIKSQTSISENKIENSNKSE